MKYLVKLSNGETTEWDPMTETMEDLKLVMDRVGLKVLSWEPIKEEAKENADFR